MCVRYFVYRSLFIAVVIIPFVSSRFFLDWCISFVIYVVRYVFISFISSLCLGLCYVVRLGVLSLCRSLCLSVLMSVLLMYVFLSVVLYFSSLLFLYVVSYFLIDLFSSLVLFVRYALHSFGRDVVRSFVISFVRYVCSFISCLFRFFYNVDRRSCSSSVIYLCRSSFRYFVMYGGV